MTYAAVKLIFDLVHALIAWFSDFLFACFFLLFFASVFIHFWFTFLFSFSTLHYLFLFFLIFYWLLSLLLCSGSRLATIFCLGWSLNINLWWLLRWLASHIYDLISWEGLRIYIHAWLRTNKHVLLMRLNHWRRLYFHSIHLSLNLNHLFVRGREPWRSSVTEFALGISACKILIAHTFLRLLFIAWLCWAWRIPRNLLLLLFHRMFEPASVLFFVLALLAISAEGRLALITIHWCRSSYWCWYLIEVCREHNVIKSAKWYTTVSL